MRLSHRIRGPRTAISWSMSVCRCAWKACAYKQARSKFTRGWTTADTCRTLRRLSPKYGTQGFITGSGHNRKLRMAISYNDPITFGRYGNAKNLNCTGIDFSEEGTQSWTSAPVAELDIQLPFARQDIVLQLDAIPFVFPEVVSSQKVFIFLGGLFIGYWSLRGHEIRDFPVNRGAISNRLTRLSLVIPNATSPNLLNISEDMRELGIYLNSIVFKTEI
jgi:hypothetical protein